VEGGSPKSLTDRKNLGARFKLPTFGTAHHVARGAGRLLKKKLAMNAIAEERKRKERESGKEK